MQNKLFLKASDICELLEVKQTSAYEIIGNLNDYSGALLATCPDFESHHSGE